MKMEEQIVVNKGCYADVNIEATALVNTVRNK
jgi:hypothetical protein